MTELMGQHCCTDYSLVIDGNFACEFCRVANDTLAPNDTIVGNVHIFHQKVMASYTCCTFCCGATRDSYILTDTVIIAYFTCAFFTFEFQVLWFRRYTGSWKELVMASNTCTIVNSDTVLEYVIVAHNSVLVDETERPDNIIVA